MTTDLLIDKLRADTDLKLEYYKRSFVEKKIKARMLRLNLDTDLTYFDHIMNNSEESRLFSEKLRENFSIFFVDYKQLKQLRFLIKTTQHNHEKILHIWECLGASGEESYSIAMYFDQLKKNTKNFPNFKIVTSITDQNALNVAKKGIYSENNLYLVPRIFKETYFKKIPQNSGNGSIYEISDDIKTKVKFIKEDMFTGHSKEKKYDLIFCRNFLFYIKEPYKRKMIQIFENHLSNWGIIIVGMNEMIMNPYKNFKPIDMWNRFYVKNTFKKNSWFEIRQTHRNDRISKVNLRGELLIPIGHYSIIDLNSNESKSSKFTLLGLGSCIGLILQDKSKKIYGVSHILLHDSSVLKNPPLIRYPHKYADTSIKDLLEKMLRKGAKKKNLIAIIIGGSNVFKNETNKNNNITMVKKELNNLKIPIEFEDVGGSRGRNAKYDANNNSVMLKKTGELEYKRIY